MFERIFRVAKENNVVVATLRELVYTRYIRSANISIILFSAEHFGAVIRIRFALILQLVPSHTRKSRGTVTLTVLRKASVFFSRSVFFCCFSSRYSFTCCVRL